MTDFVVNEQLLSIEQRLTALEGRLDSLARLVDEYRADVSRRSGRPAGQRNCKACGRILSPALNVCPYCSAPVPLPNP